MSYFYTLSLANLQSLKDRRIKLKKSVFNKSSAVAETGDSFARIDMGRNVGGAVPLRGGGAGLHLTQCGLGRGLLPYHVAT